MCNDFAFTVDSGDYERFVSLFVPTGVFERAGQRSVGHEAIRSFLNARPVGRATRHICTNISIAMTGPETATGRSSAMMFQAASETPVKLPLQVSAPVVVDYADNYLLTPDGWKFQHRRTTIVFQP